MLKELPRMLTPIEWQVLQVLWDLRQANATGVSAILRKIYGVTMSPKAVRLLLLDLKELGIVRSATAPPVRRGRPLVVYGPALDKKELTRLLTRRFLADNLMQPEEFLAVLEKPDRPSESK